MTGGNALLVEELLSELEATGTAPDAATVRALGTTGVERVGRTVKRRLDLLPSGQVVGVIDDLPTCKELIDRIVAEATKTLENLEGSNA